MTPQLAPTVPESELLVDIERDASPLVSTDVAEAYEIYASVPRESSPEFHSQMHDASADHDTHDCGPEGAIPRKLHSNISSLTQHPPTAGPPPLRPVADAELPLKSDKSSIVTEVTPDEIQVFNERFDAQQGNYASSSFPLFYMLVLIRRNTARYDALRNEDERTITRLSLELARKAAEIDVLRGEHHVTWMCYLVIV